MFRYLCVALLPLAIASAEYLYGEHPTLNYNTEYASAYDNYKPRDYKFEYGVSDPHTGDHKSQWEVRENGVVRGAYSLLEADGTTRVVEYYADDTGFHADVKKIGTAVHAAPEAHVAVAPVVKTHIADGIAYNGYGHGGLEHGYGAPIAAIQHVAVAPQLEHIAPIAKVEHIAPLQQIIAPQIHQLQQYAPIHLDKYASVYSQAAPAHFAHEYKLEHAPIAPKAHYAPIAQAPLVASFEKYSPIAYAAEAKFAPIEKYSPIAPAYFNNDLKAYGALAQGQYNAPIAGGHYEQAQFAAPAQYIEKAPVTHYTPEHIQQTHYIEKAPIVYQQELAPQHIAPAHYVEKAQVAYEQPQYFKQAPAQYVEKAHIAPINYEQAQYYNDAHIAPTQYLKEARIAPEQYIKEAHIAPEQYIKEAHIAPQQYIKEAHIAPAQYIQEAPVQYSHATKIHHEQPIHHQHQINHDQHNYQEPQYYQAHYAQENGPVSYHQQTKVEHKPVVVKGADYYDGAYKQEVHPYADYSQHQAY